MYELELPFEPNINFEELKIIFVPSNATLGPSASPALNTPLPLIKIPSPAVKLVGAVAPIPIAPPLDDEILSGVVFKSNVSALISSPLLLKINLESKIIIGKEDFSLNTYEQQILKKISEWPKCLQIS